MRPVIGADGIDEVSAVGCRDGGVFAGAAVVLEEVATHGDLRIGSEPLCQKGP